MGRLKGVPSVLSPDLLHTLALMGHGDEIVFADANFPAWYAVPDVSVTCLVSTGKNTQKARLCEIMQMSTPINCYFINTF